MFDAFGRDFITQRKHRLLIKTTGTLNFLGLTFCIQFEIIFKLVEIFHWFLPSKF